MVRGKNGGFPRETSVNVWAAHELGLGRKSLRADGGSARIGRH